MSFLSLIFNFCGLFTCSFWFIFFSCVIMECWREAPFSSWSKSLQHIFSGNLNTLSYREETWNLFCRCWECLCLLQTILDLGSSSANMRGHFLQFVWHTKSNQWCTEQHEFQWSALPKAEANYSRQAVTGSFMSDINLSMKPWDPSCLLGKLATALLMLESCFSFFLCLINASSVESDLRSVYIQFLKNSVCICDVKIPGFLSLQFVAKKMP